MMKLNNKGITLVELILSFTILALFVIAMLETVLSVRRRAANELFAQEMIAFKDTTVKTIEDDLLKKEVVGAVCEGLSCTITFADNTTKVISLNTSTKIVTYDGIDYEIPNKDHINFGSISMTVEDIDETRDLLTISINYLEKSTSEPNYGFKIQHPFTPGT